MTEILGGCVTARIENEISIKAYKDKGNVTAKLERDSTLTAKVELDVVVRARLVKCED